MIADALALRSDHIAITGDLVNLGLPAEHEAALSGYANVGPPDKVTVIPGNHDIYSSMRGDRGVARWADYMGCEEDTLAFPFVRRVGPLALVGLNSAVETPPFIASGRLGPHQLEIAQEQLAELGEEGAIRVVLIHHPPLASLDTPRRGLKDAAHLTRLLERGDAELVLYGHNHKPKVTWLPTLGKPVPLVGVGFGVGRNRAWRRTVGAVQPLYVFQKSGRLANSSCRQRARYARWSCHKDQRNCSSTHPRETCRAHKRARIGVIRFAKRPIATQTCAFRNHRR